jgi:hypothetical protein
MLAINRSIAIVLFIAASTCSLFAKDRETATVVQYQTTQHSYDWSRDGSAYVSCGGNSCYAQFSEALSGTATVNGADLNLQFTNGTIAVASCVAKYDVGMNILALTAAAASNTAVVSPLYRSCRAPAMGSIVGVEFDKKEQLVKLFMVEEDAKGKQHQSHETYKVDGWLRPSVAQVSSPTDVQMAHLRLVLSSWSPAIDALNPKIDVMNKECVKRPVTVDCMGLLKGVVTEIMPLYSTHIQALQERINLDKQGYRDDMSAGDLKEQLERATREQKRWQKYQDVVAQMPDSTPTLNSASVASVPRPTYAPPPVPTATYAPVPADVQAAMVVFTESCGTNPGAWNLSCSQWHKNEHFPAGVPLPATYAPPVVVAPRPAYPTAFNTGVAAAQYIPVPTAFSAGVAAGQFEQIQRVTRVMAEDEVIEKTIGFRMLTVRQQCGDRSGWTKLCVDSWRTLLTEASVNTESYIAACRERLELDQAGYSDPIGMEVTQKKEDWGIGNLAKLQNSLNLIKPLS